MHTALSRRPVPAPRSIVMPREHGAYGQLALPLATSLAIGRPTGAAWALAAAAIAAFLAHEPMLVLLGQRGARADRRAARNALALLVLAGGIAAALGLGLAPRAARVGAVAAALPAIAALVGMLRQRERTTLGEVLAAVALVALALPVALAAGVDPRRAVGAAVAWAGTFAVHVAAVRGVILRFKCGAPTWEVTAAPAGAALLTAGAVAATLAGLIAPAVPVVLALAAVAAVVLALWAPSPRHLRAMGWSLLACDVAALVGLCVGLR